MTLRRVRRRAAATAQNMTARWLAALLATAVIAVTIGYTAGVHSVVTIVDATATASATQITALGPDGFAYTIPSNGVMWIDAHNGIHEGDRPTCLPDAGTTRPIRFAAVTWASEGVASRAVVSILCRD